jgi:hypothetical protein
MLRLAIAVLVGLILAAPTARGQGVDSLWAGTHWGESDAALLQQLGKRATVLPQAIDFGDSYAQLVLRQFALGGYGLIVYYQIDKATHGLKRIQLERPRHSVNPPAFHGVLEALEAAYGGADQQCGAHPGPESGFQGAAEFIWRRSGVVIRAIFRDTTLEAFGGCYSPACGLTGQLLVRISPPEGDDAQCRPPGRLPPAASHAGTGR